MKKSFLKQIGNSLLSKSGYRLADVRNVHDELSFVTRLRAASFLPETIVDIGVAHGTPYLYRGFPDAHFLLFDPTKESLPHMLQWAKEIRADVFNIALGRENTTATIHNRETTQHSTFLHDLTQPPILSSYEVEVKRFDDLDLKLSKPTLVKIDVEGFELRVLQGMTGCIGEIDLFIIETSLASLYDGGNDALDILSFMNKCGFRPVDIAGITRRPKDSMIHQIDFVFAREGTDFAERSWE